LADGKLQAKKKKKKKIVLKLKFR